MASFRLKEWHTDRLPACSLFEQGLAYVGTDYLSHGLWDKYLAYELAQNDTLRVAAVYQQVLSSPIRDLDRYFNR